MTSGEDSKFKIGLLGASFDTGNLGVSALAESSIKIMLNKWPNAEIYLLGSGYEPKAINLNMASGSINLESIPIRFSKNIFLPYHFLQFFFFGLITKILPGKSLKKKWAKRSQYFNKLYEMDLAVDITGGDSFSDIYGLKRFIFSFLQKWLIIFLDKKLVFLQQTYGPFDKKITRTLARYILKHAEVVYSRDNESLELVKSLLKTNTSNGKLKYVPDAAFVLDPQKPEQLEIGSFSDIRNEDSVVVGLNISGLLYNGGYTQDNMFKLKANYPELILKICEQILENKNTLLLLVPHVFPPKEYEVESDSNACLDVYNKLQEKFPNRIFMARGEYSHSEIKYIIGMCDFFLGSRMHSCIAALSQEIPAVGLAYSKKFIGVYNSINAGELVIELRDQSEDEILKKINKLFSEREKIASNLKNTIPGIKDKVQNTLVAIG